MSQVKHSDNKMRKTIHHCNTKWTLAGPLFCCWTEGSALKKVTNVKGKVMPAILSATIWCWCKCCYFNKLRPNAIKNVNYRQERNKNLLSFALNQIGSSYGIYCSGICCIFPELFSFLLGFAWKHFVTNVGFVKVHKSFKVIFLFTKNHDINILVNFKQCFQRVCLAVVNLIEGCMSQQ